MVVVGGCGTNGVCLGGDEASERSTFAYVSYASPRDDSGTQARRKDAAFELLVDEEEVGRCIGSTVDGFC